MTEKIYYSMGEVAEMLDVNPSLIRYWGTQFDTIRPKRNKKGNRLFTPEDLEQLKLIYHLVKERKMTLEGARKALRNRGVVKSEATVDVDLLERLQGIRSLLLEIRESFGAEEDEVVVEVESSVSKKVSEEPMLWKLLYPRVLQSKVRASPNRRSAREMEITSRDRSNTVLIRWIFSLYRSASSATKSSKTCRGMYVWKKQATPKATRTSPTRSMTQRSHAASKVTPPRIQKKKFMV